MHSAREQTPLQIFALGLSHAIDRLSENVYLIWYMKILPAVFYISSNGHEPVREFLKDLGKPDSFIVGSDIKTVELGWPIGMPLCRNLGHGIWEIRSTISGHRIVRVLFFVIEGKMCLLHAFIKKTQETPQDELALALKRKAETERSAK